MFHHKSHRMSFKSLLLATFLVFALKLDFAEGIVGGRDAGYPISTKVAHDMPELMFQFPILAKFDPEILDKYPYIIKKYPEYMYNRPELRERWEQRQTQDGVANPSLVLLKMFLGILPRSDIETELSLQECEQPKKFIQGLCALIPLDKLSPEEETHCQNVYDMRELEDVLEEEMTDIEKLNEKYQKLMDDIKKEIGESIARQKNCEAITSSEELEMEEDLNITEEMRDLEDTLTFLERLTEKFDKVEVYLT